jgi:mono/diheme cytochrome c family protein
MSRLVTVSIFLVCLFGCDSAERALVPSAQAAPEPPRSAGDRQSPGTVAQASVPEKAVSPAPAAAAPAAPVQPAALSGDALVARGGQLVNMGGCGDCHTPMRFEPALGMPVPNRALMLSGHPQGGPEPASQPGKGDQAVIGATFTSFRLPFGVVYSANLTPDKETGLGKWTAEQFIATMRTGHEKGTGRQLLPPMPWQNLSTASDDDLKAIFAFLQSIPAVKNKVPAPNVPAEVIEQIAKSYEAAAKMAQK